VILGDTMSFGVRGLFIAMLLCTNGHAGETEMSEVPFLRRHDPDQVRRVSAGPHR
jgi:hypothetical protein